MSLDIGARSSRALGIASALLAAGFGFWVGERGWLPSLGSMATSTAACLLAAAFLGRGPATRALVGGASLALFSIAYLAGSASHTRAFNECVTRGAHVRTALESYRTQHGRFPERLADLGHELPCRCITGGSILEYHRTENGYALAFNDWLIEHAATETEPFLAQK